MKTKIKIFLSSFLIKSGFIRLYGNIFPAVSILMFHRVNPFQDCHGLSILPELFEQQIMYLKNQHEIVSLKTAVDQIGKKKINRNMYVITFDDGYQDNFNYAFPILKKYCVPVTIFITYDAIESGMFGWGAFDNAILTTDSKHLNLDTFGLGSYLLSNLSDREKAVRELHRKLKIRLNDERKAVVEFVLYNYGNSKICNRYMLTWEQIREMSASELVTIGSHTVTHPILSKISSEQAWNEIVTCKKMIEDRLGEKVHHFAYPNGEIHDFTSESISMVRGAGYLSACTTISGRNKAGANPFRLKRFDVTTAMSTDTNGRFESNLFRAKISGCFP